MILTMWLLCLDILMLTFPFFALQLRAFETVTLIRKILIFSSILMPVFCVSYLRASETLLTVDSISVWQMFPDPHLRVSSQLYRIILRIWMLCFEFYKELKYWCFQSLTLIQSINLVEQLFTNFARIVQNNAWRNSQNND